MNLHGRSSLDPRWTRHHNRVVRGFMLAKIKVVRKNPNVELRRDPVTKKYIGQFETIVEETWARIQPYGIMGDRVVAQDPTGRRLMRVQVENLALDIELDDVIHILESPADEQLVDYTMQVRSAVGSSNSWIRDLVCEMDLKGS